MRTSKTRRFTSYVLFAGAAILLSLGAREILEWHLGQRQAAVDFETKSVTKPSPSKPTPGPAPEQTSPRSGETIGKLMIPRLKAEIYVIEGESEADLRKGPGHLPYTAKPGGKGNCVIAGHRDTHFRVLKDIRKGDDIAIETRDGLFLYRVKSTRIISPKNTSPLKPTKYNALNLITCYPFYYVGSAPKRFIVEAELAGSVPRVT
jgi:sortase A